MGIICGSNKFKELKRENDSLSKENLQKQEELKTENAHLNDKNNQQQNQNNEEIIRKTTI